MRADATTCELWLAEKHHAHECQQCMHMRAAHTYHFSSQCACEHARSSHSSHNVMSVAAVVVATVVVAVLVAVVAASVHHQFMSTQCGLQYVGL